MTKLTIFAVAMFIGLGGASYACEQHESHAALTTATVTPVAKPLSAPAVVPAAIQVAPAAAQSSPDGVTAMEYTGLGSCMKRNKTEQTVILTD